MLICHAATTYAAWKWKTTISASTFNTQQTHGMKIHFDLSHSDCFLDFYGFKFNKNETCNPPNSFKILWNNSRIKREAKTKQQNIHSFRLCERSKKMTKKHYFYSIFKWSSMLAIIHSNG